MKKFTYYSLVGEGPPIVDQSNLTKLLYDCTIPLLVYTFVILIVY
jgi:hypothetical protein